MQKIVPCLWFDHQAEEAAQFYSQIFKNSRVTKVARYSESGSKVSGQKAGSVMTVSFQLEGQEFLGLNGGPTFKFSPAISFVVACETESEINEKWQKLSAGGSVLMGLDKYPFAEKYGWCADRFGVNWQLMLTSKKQKIIPALLFVGDKFGRGEEALNFYLSQFQNSQTLSVARDENTKSIAHAGFTLAGQEFALMESGLKDHQFTFTHAISFVVNCTSQAEVDKFWDQLSKGGSTEPCGWLMDKFGVSWQVVPTILNELMSSPDAKKNENVMQAMLKMSKLDIATLEKAARL